MAYTNNSLLQLQLCNNYYQALQYCQVGVGNVYPRNIYPARWHSLSRPSGFVCRSQLVGHHLTNARLQRIPIPSRRLSDIIPTQAPLHQLRTVSSNLNHFQSRFQMPTNCPTNGQRSSLLSVTTPSFSVLPDPTMHDSVSTVADKSHSVTACSPLSYLAPESDSSSLPVSAETEVTVTAASPETCHTNIDIKLQFHFPVVANSVKKNSERCGVSCSSVPNSPDSLSGDGNETQYIVIDSDEFSDSEFVPEILLPFSEDSDCLSPTVDLHSTSTNNVNITNIIADSKLPVFPESDSQFRSEMASSVRITNGGVEQCEVSSSVSDSPKELPAVQAVVTDATVQPKPLSKSQRQCRSKAIKRAAKLASIVNNLSPSVQQASKVRPCAVTGNSETEESTCSDRGQMQKDSSEASAVVTVSTQSASPKECFSTSIAVMSNDNKGIFSSISTGGTDSTDIIVIDDDEIGNTADTVSNNDTVDSDLPVITNSASDVTRHDVMSTVKSDVVPTSEDFVVIDSADDITSAKTGIVDVDFDAKRFLGQASSWT